MEGQVEESEGLGEARRMMLPERGTAGAEGGMLALCAPQAAYLQRLGVSTAVFERRHVIGGAAVTEEIIPGEPQEVVWGTVGSDLC